MRKPKQECLSKLFLRTTDTKTERLGFFYSENLAKTYQPKISDRNLVQMIEDPGEQVVSEANNFIEEKRKVYQDFFLSNFLPSKNSNRKRIPIGMASRVLRSFMFK